MSTRTCRECGVAVPPRYRKCDDCLTRRDGRHVVRVVEGQRVWEATGGYKSPVDMVLDCGHVVASTRRSSQSEQLWCPLHRRFSPAIRRHNLDDENDVPVVKPVMWR